LYQAKQNESAKQVKFYQKEYQTKSDAFLACKPDDPGTSCDSMMQNQLALQMKEAG